MRTSRSPLSPTLLAVGMLIWCAAAATPAAANNCAAGGQPRPDEGGIGGTGLRPVAPGPVAPDDDSGIGGTGISARGDTGVIGTVTGFASICVGGTEIHYGADTPIQVDGRAATAAQLAVGDVVEVVASGGGSELQAQQITVRHVLSGPVTGVDTQRQTIEVMGQTVQLSPVTRAVEGGQETVALAAAFPPTTPVQVSGMRRGDDVVVASRVSRVEAGDLAQVVGPVTKVEPDGVWISGTAVRIDGQEGVAIGDEVRVAGRWDGNAIVAGTVEAIPRVPFNGRVARVDIEGYAHPITADQIRVGHFAVELPAAAAQEALRLPAADARLRIHAVVQDRRVIVERIGVMDDLPGVPPPPPRDLHESIGGRPNEGREHIGGPPPEAFGGGLPPKAFGGPGQHQSPPMHDGPPPREGPAEMPDARGGFETARPPGERPPGPELPDRPFRPTKPDRPPAPEIPDRPFIPQAPDRPSLPQMPDRPSRPERPQMPDRPQLPDRPPPPERPELPERPTNRGRP